MIQLIFDTILVGIGAGAIYGIFGGGSGLIMMPGFYYLLRHMGVHADIKMQVAVATCAASSCLLGISASRLQWVKGYVDGAVFKKLVPGIFTGTVVAVALLNFMPSHLLKPIFGVVVILVGFWMWRYKQESGKIWSLGAIKNYICTTLIGFLWFSLGVAVFTVPYLYKTGIDLKKAVGTTTVISTVFSGVAALLFIISGLMRLGFHHDFTLGYVNGFLMLVSVIPSAISAYLGAQFSQRLPRAKIKIFYAAIIVIVGSLMLFVQG